MVSKTCETCRHSHWERRGERSHLICELSGLDVCTAMTACSLWKPKAYVKEEEK
jgi:hypothetical protein